jgi:pimeloyl-ACP methyl ester carboxylesterase
MAVSLRLADGRVLEYVSIGEGGAGTLLFHHGTPSAWDVPSSLLEAAGTAGLGVVSAARPGYAGSSGAAGRDVAAVVADTAALLDHLDVGSTVVVGWSGGGPHALACAALLPERVTAVAVMAGVAPHDADGLDWTAGMGAANLEEFAAAAGGVAELGPYLLLAREAVLGGSVDVDGPTGLEDPLDSLLSPADREAMASGLAEELGDSMARGLRPGIEGWLDDDLAFVAPWGFDPATLTMPATVWHGTEDLMVPPAHGEWLAERIPACRLEVLAGDGHLSLGRHAGEIVARLLG